MALCSIDGCENAIAARGWCRGHYERWKRNGDPLGGRRAPKLGLYKCEIDNCENRPYRRGYCVKHYRRIEKHGDPHKSFCREYGSGKKWRKDNLGYVSRFAGRGEKHANGNGRVYQHRQVMGDMIGRELRAGENVHHKNGDRADNRPENLELWVSGQPSGQRLQDVVSWAISVLLSGSAEDAAVLDPKIGDQLNALRRYLKSKD